MYFSDALCACLYSSKYVARSSFAAGTFVYYDPANKRVSKWTGGAGGWNDPNTSSGSGAAYNFTMGDIVDGTSGLPVNDWSIVG